MSNEKKAMKERMLINSAMSSIKRQIANLDKFRDKYIQHAKVARQQGIASQYNLAKSAITMATSQKNLLSQMLLNIELSAQIKDVSSMTKTFADGMQVLSGSITETAAGMNFEKTTELMNKAVMGVEQKNMELDSMLSMNASAFENMGSSSNITSDEIDALIDNEIGVTSISGSEDMLSEIEELEKKLKA